LMRRGIRPGPFHHRLLQRLHGRDEAEFACGYEAFGFVGVAYHFDAVVSWHSLCLAFLYVLVAGKMFIGVGRSAPTPDRDVG
jgi:hypothetical protein